MHIGRTGKKLRKYARGHAGEGYVLSFPHMVKTNQGEQGRGGGGGLLLALKEG